MNDFMSLSIARVHSPNQTLLSQAPWRLSHGFDCARRKRLSDTQTKKPQEVRTS